MALMKRTPLLKTLLLLTWCVGRTMGWAEEAQNRIIAVVNNDVITTADVEQAMAPLYGQYQAVYRPDELPSRVQEAQQQIINLLIEERLMLQEARAPRPVEVAKGRWATPTLITVSDEELADAIAQAKGRFSSEAEFLQALQQHHMTLQDLEARYRDQMTIQRLVDREVRSRIAVAPSEITAYYQAHMDDYRSPEAVRLSNILIRVSGMWDDARAKAKAHDLWSALKAGATFAELARRHSEGPNADGGGMMGWIERGRLMPEIEQAVFAIEPGQLTPVVKSPLGYHIFRIEERRPAQTKPVAEVSGEIEDALYQEQYRQRYAEWIGRLKEHAYINVK